MRHLTPTALATDQRGQARDDLQCDIGAFELKFDDSPTVSLPPGAALRTYGPTRIGVQVTGGDPGVITVTKSISWTTPPTIGNALLTKWTITPTNSSYTVTLKLCWLPGELNGVNTDIANLKFWRKSGITWTSFAAASVDATAGCATLAGVDGFSTWTLGGADQPNVVTLRDLTATANTSPGMIGAMGAAFAALSVWWAARRTKGKTLT